MKHMSGHKIVADCSQEFLKNPYVAMLGTEVAEQIGLWMTNLPLKTFSNPSSLIRGIVCSLLIVR